MTNNPGFRGLSMMSVDLVDRYGSPPQIIWLTCGNTSNARLREILSVTLPEGLQLLRLGERLVEIGGAV